MVDVLSGGSSEVSPEVTGVVLRMVVGEREIDRDQVVAATIAGFSPIGLSVHGMDLVGAAVWPPAVGDIETASELVFMATPDLRYVATDEGWVAATEWVEPERSIPLEDDSYHVFGIAPTGVADPFNDLLGRRLAELGGAYELAAAAAQLDAAGDHQRAIVVPLVDASQQDELAWKLGRGFRPPLHLAALTCRPHGQPPICIDC